MVELNQDIKDPSQIGNSGLKGINVGNQPEPDPLEEFSNMVSNMPIFLGKQSLAENAYNAINYDATQALGVTPGYSFEGYGDSKYDATATSRVQLLNLEKHRGQEQSFMAGVGSFFMQVGGAALTSAVGAIGAIPAGLIAATSNNNNQNFWSNFIDNDFNRFLDDLNQDVINNNRIYNKNHTEDEAWYKNKAGWGEGAAQGIGFLLGLVLSSYSIGGGVTKGATKLAQLAGDKGDVILGLSNLSVKQLGNVSKQTIQANKLLSNPATVEAGRKIQGAVSKIIAESAAQTKAVNGIGRTVAAITAANYEASVEAMGTKDRILQDESYLKVLEELDYIKKNKEAELFNNPDNLILVNYPELGISSYELKPEKKAELKEFNDAIDKRVTDLTDAQKKAAEEALLKNYAANILVVSASNIAMFGRGAINRFANRKALSGTGKGIGKFVVDDAGKIALKNSPKTALKASGKILLSGAREFGEEASQATTDEFFSRQGNRNINYESFTQQTYDPNSIIKSSYDYATLVKDAGESIAEAFEGENLRGNWIGFGLGIIGLPIARQNSKFKKDSKTGEVKEVGKYKFKFQTEAQRVFKQEKEERARKEDVVAEINKRLEEQGVTFPEYFKAMNRASIIEANKQTAVENNDKFEYKNQEMNSLISDYILFSQLGKTGMDNLLSIPTQLSKLQTDVKEGSSIDEKQMEFLIDVFGSKEAIFGGEKTDAEGNVTVVEGAYQGFTANEVYEDLQRKGKEDLENLKIVSKNATNLKSILGDRVSKDVFNELVSLTSRIDNALYRSSDMITSLEEIIPSSLNIKLFNENIIKELKGVDNLLNRKIKDDRVAILDAAFNSPKEFAKALREIKSEPLSKYEQEVLLEHIEELKGTVISSNKSNTGGTLVNDLASLYDMISKFKMLYSGIDIDEIVKQMETLVNNIKKESDQELNKNLKKDITDSLNETYNKVEFENLQSLITHLPVDDKLTVQKIAYLDNLSKGDLNKLTPNQKKQLRLYEQYKLYQIFIEGTEDVNNYGLKGLDEVFKEFQNKLDSDIIHAKTEQEKKNYTKTKDLFEELITAYLEEEITFLERFTKESVQAFNEKIKKRILESIEMEGFTIGEENSDSNVLPIISEILDAITKETSTLFEKHENVQNENKRVAENLSISESKNTKEVETLTKNNNSPNSSNINEIENLIKNIDAKAPDPAIISEIERLTRNPNTQENVVDKDTQSEQLADEESEQTESINKGEETENITSEITKIREELKEPDGINYLEKYDVVTDGNYNELILKNTLKNTPTYEYYDIDLSKANPNNEATGNYRIRIDTANNTYSIDPELKDHIRRDIDTYESAFNLKGTKSSFDWYTIIPGKVKKTNNGYEIIEKGTIYLTNSAKQVANLLQTGTFFPKKSIPFTEINKRLNGELINNGITEKVWNSYDYLDKDKALKNLKFSNKNVQYQKQIDLQVDNTTQKEQQEETIYIKQEIEVQDDIITVERQSDENKETESTSNTITPSEFEALVIDQENSKVEIPIDNKENAPADAVSEYTYKDGEYQSNEEYQQNRTDIPAKAPRSLLGIWKYFNKIGVFKKKDSGELGLETNQEVFFVIDKTYMSDYKEYIHKDWYPIFMAVKDSKGKTQIIGALNSKNDIYKNFNEQLKTNPELINNNEENNFVIFKKDGKNVIAKIQKINPPVLIRGAEFQSFKNAVESDAIYGEDFTFGFVPPNTITSRKEGTPLLEIRDKNNEVTHTEIILSTKPSEFFTKEKIEELVEQEDNTIIEILNSFLKAFKDGVSTNDIYKKLSEVLYLGKTVIDENGVTSKSNKVILKTGKNKNGERLLILSKDNDNRKTVFYTLDEIEKDSKKVLQDLLYELTLRTDYFNFNGNTSKEYADFLITNDLLKTRALSVTPKNSWVILEDAANPIENPTIENQTVERSTTNPIDIEANKQADFGNIFEEDIDDSVVQYQKQIDLQAEQDGVLEEFANSLSERFNISFDLISEEEAKSISSEYTSEPAFFDPKTKKAYLVKGKANKTSAVHEIFTHPFLLQIEKTNPTLYKNLLKEAKNNKSVVDYVDNLYSTKQNNDHEYISRAIDLAVQGELDQQKDKTLLGRIQDFFNQLSDYLKQLFNIPKVFSSAISPNITLQQLTQFAMYGKGKMNLNPAQENIEYSLKVTNVIIKNLDKIKQWEKNKSISEDVLWNKIQGLGVPKEQLELIKNSEGNTVEEKLLDFANQYGYTIEINTARGSNAPTNYVEDQSEYYENQIRFADKFYVTYEREGKFIVFSNDFDISRQSSWGSRDINSPKFNTREEAEIYRKELVDDKIKSDTEKLNEIREFNPTLENTQHYSYLTVPGGINYTENAIQTPNIINSSTAHINDFAKGIANMLGWFRSDEQYITSKDYPLSFRDNNGKWEKENNIWYYLDDDGITHKREDLDDTDIYAIYDNEYSNRDYLQKGINTKTRRILEIQSDLFQKGRDSNNLLKSPKLLKVGDSFTLDDETYTVKNIIVEGFYEDGVSKGVYTLERLSDSKTTKIDERAFIKRFGERTLNKPENQFLQLLNKDSNWVTFFVKSIIQDSAKKGYEKVLFPKGDTAAKIEGHQTLEEFKKQKEDRIKELEEELEGSGKIVDNFTNKGIYYYLITPYGKTTESRYDNQGNFITENAATYYKEDNTTQENYLKGEQQISFTEYRNAAKEANINIDYYKLSIEQIVNKEGEIKTLKQELERVDREGFAALKPIYNFYENTVANILKKQGYNAVEITDEYGNQWNEVTIDENRDNQNIVFQKSIPPKNASQETKNKYIQGLIESDFKNSPPFKDIQHLLSDKIKKYNLTEKLWDNSYTTEEKKQALKC